jgi:hypothetical protein
MKRFLCALAFFVWAFSAYAAPGERVSLPTRDGVTQSIYIQTATDNPPWVVVLFSGDSGALHLSTDGPTAFKGNFLVRTAGYWVDKGDAAVLYDTPSDYAGGVSDKFRLSKDAITDLTVVIGELRKRYPSSKIALIGTSRGTVSVGNAIERVPTVADAFVLTSPVSVARGRGVGLSGLDVDGSKYRVLVISNQHDACPVSPLYGGKRLAERNHFDFIAVDSTEGGGVQADCGGHSPHGFLGIEQQVLDDIDRWLTARTVVSP